MTDTTPNPQQRRLIDAREGLYAVDAGAGTGKTFTITKRYAALIEEPHLEPEDILLVTFTRNAAAEMKERVVAEGEYSMAALRDAPITTFHGWCHDLLRNYGLDAPTHIGIDDRITTSTTLLENEVIEKNRFRAFLRGFVEDHPEHHDFFRILNDPTSLLGIIKELASKGVFPARDGWYRNGDRYVEGDFVAFEKLFESANEPNPGENGPNQSDLMKSLSGFDRERCVPEDAPSEADLRRGDHRIDASWCQEAFHEDREALKAFVHDVYHEYIAFALERNYLNFSFLQLFAFVLLCDDHDLRDRLQYDHVMVDEFQDTSEIQFKLALLLCGTGNFCVVGDWKQSIYGFQYASVDNIRRFETRLARFAHDLNADHERVTFQADGVTELSLRTNYRSTQAILNCSEQSLTLPATSSDDVDESVADEITSLDAHTDRDHSIIEAYHSDGEGIDGVLDRIQTVYDNDRFAVEDEDGGLRPPTHDDIAVLTRKRRFGRELQARADELGIPMAYQGGVNLYETEPAILLLAWLRVLEDASSSRGWAVILEEAGYTLDEMQHLLGDGEIPEPMRLFRADLADRETVAEVARGVFARYGLDDGYTDALITTVQSVADRTLGTRGDVIRFIEDSIEAEETVEVTDTPGGDAVTVQTIHAAKGLEYPIVIVADITDYSFPARGGGFGSRIRYDDPIGLRQTKVYRSEGQPHVYDNWCYRVLSGCIQTSYDEERRLLYVTMTRAQDHLLFMAGEDPSPFFEELDREAIAVDPDPKPAKPPAPEQTHLQISVPTRETPVGHTPHTLMDDRVFENVTEGRGTAYGNEVHEFAERYANGEVVDVDPDASEPDTANVKALIDRLPGELIVEEFAYLPVEVGGEQITISGVIDLLHVTEDAVEIIDYKTDLSRHAEEQYSIQLSIYYHVVKAVYPDRDIDAKLYYSESGNLVDIAPLSKDDIHRVVTEAATGRSASS